MLSVIVEEQSLASAGIRKAAKAKSTWLGFKGQEYNTLTKTHFIESNSQPRKTAFGAFGCP